MHQRGDPKKQPKAESKVRESASHHKGCHTKRYINVLQPQHNCNNHCQTNVLHTSNCQTALYSNNCQTPVCTTTTAKPMCCTTTTCKPLCCTTTTAKPLCYTATTANLQPAVNRQPGYHGGDRRAPCCALDASKST